MSDENYEDLNLRQKSLVDAIALNQLDDKDLNSDEVTELASELSGEKKYTRSTYYQFKEKYEEIIENRKKLIANRREADDENEVVTIGDPMRSYEGPEGGIDATMQHIAERPTRADEREWAVNLSRKQIFDIVRTADKQTAWEVFTQVFE